MTGPAERYTVHPSVAILWVLTRRPFATRAWHLYQNILYGLTSAVVAPGFLTAAAASLPDRRTQHDLARDSFEQSVVQFLTTIRSMLDTERLIEQPSDTINRVIARFRDAFDALPPALRLSPHDEAAVITAMLRNAPLMFADAALREPFTRVSERIAQRAEQHGLPVRFIPFWIGDYTISE